MNNETCKFQMYKCCTDFILKRSRPQAEKIKLKFTFFVGSAISQMACDKFVHLVLVPTITKI